MDEPIPLDDHAVLARHGSRRRKRDGAPRPAVTQDDLFPGSTA